jgi:hypothetical protein
MLITREARESDEFIITSPREPFYLQRYGELCDDYDDIIINFIGNLIFCSMKSNILLDDGSDLKFCPQESIHVNSVTAEGTSPR